MALIEIADFSQEGWADSAAAGERAFWCCERLEDAQILWFPRLFFGISENDRRFMCEVQQSNSPQVKNISYDASTGLLRGYDGSPSHKLILERVLRESAESFRRLAMELLSPYARHLQADLTSFRPIEEQDRVLPTHSRNDLIHIDAFPRRPARDRRILRFFTNLNFSKPRVWITSESFERLASRMALDAGLAQYTRGGSGILQRFKHALITAAQSRLPVINRSPYDRFMLSFHDYLKMNESFQAGCRKEQVEFPAGSSWVAFTDAIPHAVVSGQCAIEQTFFLPVTSMLSPRKSPLRVLEAMVGSSLI